MYKVFKYLHGFKVSTAAPKVPLGESRRKLSGKDFAIWLQNVLPVHFGHRNRDIHTVECSSAAIVRSPQRHRMLRVPGNGNTDEIAIADDAVGGVEIDPAGAGEISLQPGMRGASAFQAGKLGRED